MAEWSNWSGVWIKKVGVGSGLSAADFSLPRFEPELIKTCWSKALVSELIKSVRTKVCILHFLGQVLGFQLRILCLNIWIQPTYVVSFQIDRDAFFSGLFCNGNAGSKVSGKREAGTSNIFQSSLVMPSCSSERNFNFCPRERKEISQAVGSLILPKFTHVDADLPLETMPMPMPHHQNTL